VPEKKGKGVRKEKLHRKKKKSLSGTLTKRSKYRKRGGTINFPSCEEGVHENDQKKKQTN